MKIKFLGTGLQVSAVLVPLPPSLTRFNWNRVPEPESGTKLFEKAEMRSVLIEPVPGIMLLVTFQLLAVSPAPCVGVLWKVTTDWLKVKSPWNPTRLSAGLIAEVATG